MNSLKSRAMNCGPLSEMMRLGDHPKPAIDDHLKTGQR
jgi:hypothetical protein